jgi:hypothetical protein
MQVTVVTMRNTSIAMRSVWAGEAQKISRI